MGRIYQNFLSLLIFVSVFSSHALAGEKPRQAFIITRDAKIPLSVEIAHSPETWADMAFIDRSVGADRGVLLHYSKNRLEAYSATGAQQAFDALLIGQSGRIMATIENMTSKGWFARPAAAIAALFVPTGFCRQRSVQPGHYFFSENVDLTTRLKDEIQPDEISIVIKKLEENLSSDPANLFWAEQLAEFLLGVKQYDRALESYQTLLTHQVKASWLNGKGISLVSLSRFNDAELVFRDAILADSSLYDPVRSLSMLLIETNRFDEGILLMLEYLLNHPDVTRARIDLIRIFLMKNLLEDALQAAKIESSRSIPDPDLLRIHGDVLLRMGDLAQAAEFYHQYLLACPFDPNASDLNVFVTVHKYRKSMTAHDSSKSIQ